MKVSRRSLTLASLGLGLGATGALALAICTDFWLLTSETLNMNAIMANGQPDLEGTPLPMNEYPDYLSNMSVPVTAPKAIMHSGLWRGCVVNGEYSWLGYVKNAIQA